VISIITPVYNGDRFMEACINVVIDQACLDIEHIIVDGGSSDRTIAILQQYAAQYSHIRWLSEPDQGQSDAMNKGIALAQGDIIAILNVDDYYEPNTLNQVSQLFSSLPQPSLLVGNCNIWDDHGNLQFVNCPKKLRFIDLLLGPDANPFPLNPAAYFYHKSLHDQIGLYSLTEHYTMDVDFLLRATQIAHVQYVNVTWGNYRQIAGTKTINDIETGQSSQRIDRLMRHYRQVLPLPQRWTIAVGYTVYKRLDWQRFQYFLDQPQRIAPVFKKKLKQLWQKQIHQQPTQQ